MNSRAPLGLAASTRARGAATIVLLAALPALACSPPAEPPGSGTRSAGGHSSSTGGAAAGTQADAGRAGSTGGSSSGMTGAAGTSVSGGAGGAPSSGGQSNAGSGGALVNGGAAGSSATADGGASGGMGGVANAAGRGGAGRSGANGGSGPTGPSTFKIFDQIPQFGMYATHDPMYSPPGGILMWSNGTVFVTKLSDEQKAGIRTKLVARLTYHAQCDNYDRLGSVFFLALPAGQMPDVEDPRTEIVRYITPFSDHMRDSLATYAYPEADLSPYAASLADSARDVWIGIVSGANPYDGDPCDDPSVPMDFQEVGYKFSVEFASSGDAPSAPGTTLSALHYSSEKKAPVTGTFDNSGAMLSGHVTIIVSGHGSADGGVEYSNSHDTVTLNGTEVGSFDTDIDCASYEKYSPDGNPGIFRNNGSSNPRNWCPGALVAAHTFPATLNTGSNVVSLAVTPSQIPSGSFYATSINFTSP